MDAKRIEDKLKESNCVLVVGRSGNGKSTIIRHIALKLLNEEGFDVIPIVLDPTTILQYHNPDRNQLFVIDDFCGKLVINAQTVEMWSLKINDILKRVDKNPQNGHGVVKVLFATQTCVFKDKVFERLGCLSKYTFQLSEMPLEAQEKIKMLKKYLAKDGKMPEDFTKNLKRYDDIFPLICKLSEGKTVEYTIQLFLNHYEVIKQDLLSLMQTNKTRILKNKADPSLCDANETSPLHAACKVEVLLKNKAEVFQLDWHNQSPIFIAASLGNDKLVRLLVNYKSDVSQSNEEGNLPLFIACEKGHRNIVDFFLNECQLSVSEIVEQADKRQRTPILVACRGGFTEIVKRLVSKGAAVNKVNIWNATPLFAASREGHLDVGRCLIKENADLNFADSNGQTPLLVACDEGNDAIVKTS
ncbi:unnamed protein product [Mytilus coruscus]|uniref:Novel STAND NTPase 3 domain-containing protein n=1 Tax=Mytilus coruscus TaxID=42192 RepID=A0A6J8B0B0_MYTCO|nr:unnamed protein product [Mytilus coruscus]